MYAQEMRIQVAKSSDMGIAVKEGLRFPDTLDLCLRLGNVQICFVPPCYVVDLLILRNRVSMLPNVQIWVVLSCKVVLRLIFTTSNFKLQNVQIWTLSMCTGVFF